MRASVPEVYAELGASDGLGLRVRHRQEGARHVPEHGAAVGEHRIMGGLRQHDY